MDNIDLAESVLNSDVWENLLEKVKLIHADSIKYPDWQITSISGLIYSVKNEYICLKSLPRNGMSYISRTAFHTRNLLELVVWCRACEADLTILRTLYEDAARDGKDFSGKFIEWGIKTQQNESWLQEAYKNAADLKVAARKHGIIDLESKYTKVRDLTKLADMETHYDISYKQLSKLAHPTAFSIIADFSPEVWNNVNFALYEQGCVNFIGAFQALNNTLSKIISI